MADSAYPRSYKNAALSGGLRQQLDLIRGIDTSAIRKVHTAAPKPVASYSEAIGIGRNFGASYSKTIANFGAIKPPASYLKTVGIAHAHAFKDVATPKAPKYRIARARAFDSALSPGFGIARMRAFQGIVPPKGIGTYKASALAKALSVSDLGYQRPAAKSLARYRASTALGEAMQRQVGERAEVEVKPLPVRPVERIDFEHVASVVSEAHEAHVIRFETMTEYVERIMLTAEVAVAEHKEAQRRAEDRADIAEDALGRIADAVEATQSDVAEARAAQSKAEERAEDAENRERHWRWITLAVTVFIGGGSIALRLVGI